MAAHLETNIPNGARNIPEIPTIIKRAKRGILEKRPSMSSISLLSKLCSAVPTQRNSNDLVMAWNMTSIMAAHTVSLVPIPAQAIINPKLATVEYANTRLALLWEIAAKEAIRKVTPPTIMAIIPAPFQPSTGDNLIIRKTPAFTMVEECSKAEVGVGATIAPSSQLEKGICAALVIPANTSSAAGTTTLYPICPYISTVLNSKVS